MNIANDLEGMRLALQWAEKGLYTTSPNPHIGCVIVKDGAVIGEGVTQPAGQDHAEIQAMKDAQRRGHDVRGATAYVTLEPCNHYGRTPPCSEALVASGLGRVVAAMEDPNPLVAGQGMARLAAAGIATETGLLAEEAYELNIGFFSRMRRQLPWVRMKTAASLDGMTALNNGQSQWITGPAARADGHHWRARACAILTGIGTVKADDPLLNVREVQTPRQPRRIVVDSRLDISPGARILEGGGTWIVAASSNHEKEAALRDRGAEIITLPNAQGKVDLPELMRELARRQINELHVEAGTKLNGSLVREGCVDELLLYMAPMLLGEAQGMFALPPLTDLSGRKQLKFHEIRQVGDDLRILARFNPQ
ncbi:bifunctional diaminohydroxyphosphoribosylaminopyrimidine deaminase/5-amino-6-(5-phosphoribosylamino)uracil reductase RibD [Massilia endophytica]|uniref:bifunctional diaminohydroxyphosphoribosylaminopyrimidine deaminase/5-amino-6-(5-phosphoribosylamino)uracil reductase RibD n=1 Tax=Massilia endophytica TaxID=2899220 RepID=UPI001E30BC03|nr:bifunctional diaminohydroxyphosphoribosylaminopyrimidine deaminase/5-amino-6-(5-phosphoribosylamino)uracil reductase RibD [Massilia endophytica]UGQ47796.1 bifunctional diaminohydroxyphosphoribosylaminopyrimidine deaminase/5-amino-6-(5-phosphoribosylamino)uracil reductase RibD [Massilia endophytica]